MSPDAVKNEPVVEHNNAIIFQYTTSACDSTPGV